MESRIERLCISRGLKMTGQRRVIARVLSEAGDHPDVEELYRRASALDQHISIATVYRTVRLFEEQGILERRDFGGGRARYEPSEDGPHYHLIDVETGKVIEFQDPEHERLMRAIAARLGFDVVSLRLELFGRRQGSPLGAHDRRSEDGGGFDAGASATGPPVGQGDHAIAAPASSKADAFGGDSIGHGRSDLAPGRDATSGGGDPRLRGTIKGPSR